MTSLRRFVGYGVVVNLLVATLPVHAGDMTSECAAAGIELATPTAQSPAPDNVPYDRLFPHNTRLDLGIGHLLPLRQHHFGWHNKIRLPLFLHPDRQPFAWIVDGWIVRTGSKDQHMLGTGGMIETGYETPSFIVHEARRDGWIRLRYAAGDDGIAWTHRCALATNTIPLAVQRWHVRLFGDPNLPLFFRSKVRHSLRAGPTTSAARLRWIPADPHEYHLEALDVKGDWLQVRLVQPSDYCSGDKRAPTDEYEGWVKWRDEQIGPWLWYYTRGC